MIIFYEVWGGYFENQYKLKLFVLGNLVKVLDMTGDTMEFYTAEYRSLEARFMDSSPKLYDFKKSLKLSVQPYTQL